MKMMYLVLKFLIYIKMTLRGKWPFLQTYSNLSLPVVRAIFWATMSPAVLQCVPMQPNTKENNRTSSPGLLHLGTADVFGWKVFAVGGCPVQCKMFNRIPVL